MFYWLSSDNIPRWSPVTDLCAWPRAAQQGPPAFRAMNSMMRFVKTWCSARQSFESAGRWVGAIIASFPFSPYRFWYWHNWPGSWTKGPNKCMLGGKAHQGWSIILVQFRRPGMSSRLQRFKSRSTFGVTNFNSFCIWFMKCIYKSNHRLWIDRFFPCFFLTQYYMYLSDSISLYLYLWDPTSVGRVARHSPRASLLAMYRRIRTSQRRSSQLGRVHEAIAG